MSMRKLFILPESETIYAEELRAARERVCSNVFELPLSGLTRDVLEREKVDVVISNGIPRELYSLLESMEIVTITIDSIERYQRSSDIVIDPLSTDTKFYFTGQKHSILRNKDFEVNAVFDLIGRLDWDSNFFGFNIAYLSCMNLTDTIYAHVVRFIERENIRLVEYLCNCHSSDSVRVAEDNGFRFTDIRLTFFKGLTRHFSASLPDGLSFGLAAEEHIPILQGIAENLYLDSRYWFDTKFDRDKVNEFYLGWVAKGVRGQFDDECWCLFEGARTVAFCTVRYTKSNLAQIGLVGLANTHQGKGLGKSLLACVMNVLLERGVAEVTVVTQGRNYMAQNLYQSMGFRTRTTQLWYHKWM
ncbi:MAG TPA: GNAT family N-acetyltransferase [Nitratidesulfovibrio sp.]|nr:GNAT family N-acetyltransferase [Nitratidesulfovibrio sp.]